MPNPQLYTAVFISISGKYSNTTTKVANVKQDIAFSTVSEPPFIHIPRRRLTSKGNGAPLEPLAPIIADDQELAIGLTRKTLVVFSV